MESSSVAQGNFEIVNMNMRMRMVFTIEGGIHEGIDRFHINVGHGKDVLNLHFNPRFDQATTVCKSWGGSNWGQEHWDNHINFCPGSHVKFIIAFQENHFKVTLPDGHVICSPNRLVHKHLHYLSANGLYVSSFQLE